MGYKDFQEYLAAHFNRFELGPSDDEWRDAYEDWLEGLDSEDFIRLANEYANKIKAGR